jgi:hypothetical protein
VQACWFSLNLHINTDDELFITLEHFKQQLGVHFYMEIIVLMSWSTWVSRNDNIFKEFCHLDQIAGPSLKKLGGFAPRFSFKKKELSLVIHRVKKKIFPSYRRMARAPTVIFYILFVLFFLNVVLGRIFVFF